MSAVRLYSIKGELLCKPFEVNCDDDCISQEQVDLPIPNDDIE